MSSVRVIVVAAIVFRSQSMQSMYKEWGEAIV